MGVATRLDDDEEWNGEKYLLDTFYRLKVCKDQCGWVRQKRGNTFDVCPYCGAELSSEVGQLFWRRIWGGSRGRGIVGWKQKVGS